jgi:tartrate-resistant acid phosphatase type 5
MMFHHSGQSIPLLSIVLFLYTLTLQIGAQTAVRFGAVGDYDDDSNTQAVADLIDSWNPDFVITVGDNNYSGGSVSAWDNQVGQFYGQFIHYPAGSTSAYAPGPPINQFFPALGNHDWDAGISGWYNYFELPGNERYYDHIQGPVHFFVIDSDDNEPDGITSNSTQGQWLQSHLASSTSTWKIVYFHHPPYSSSSGHGNTSELQWPFQSWGATAVMAGHDHVYERILKNGFPYFVNGTGGKSLYGFSSIPEPGSVVRYNSDYGAMLIEASEDSINFKFYSIASGGTLIDNYTIFASPTSIKNDEKKTIDQYSLYANYPNPFNPVTHIRFDLPEVSDVKIGVYNTLGQEVAILLEERKPAGTHVVDFDGNALSSGVYLYKIQAGSFQQVRKMVLMR